MYLGVVMWKLVLLDSRALHVVWMQVLEKDPSIDNRSNLTKMTESKFLTSIKLGQQTCVILHFYDCHQTELTDSWTDIKISTHHILS